VSWSITGNILAVSGGDNKVTLWKESIEGDWKPLYSMDESGQIKAQ
jgi:protein transport protein SEC13